MELLSSARTSLPWDQRPLVKDGVSVGEFTNSLTLSFLYCKQKH